MGLLGTFCIRRCRSSYLVVASGLHSIADARDAPADSLKTRNRLQMASGGTLKCTHRSSYRCNRRPLVDTINSINSIAFSRLDLPAGAPVVHFAGSHYKVSLPVAELVATLTAVDNAPS